MQLPEYGLTGKLFPLTMEKTQIRVEEGADMNIACFIGHRVIKGTEEMKVRLNSTIERLIREEKVDTFLFGSKSQFNDLCYELVSKLKEKHPQIRRVYVRAEFPVINNSYEAYLLERYEATYYPDKLVRAGRAVYVERNFEMIKASRFCVFYYAKTQTDIVRKSGTKIAFEYAVKKKKKIIKLP